MKKSNILLVAPFKGDVGIKDMFIAPNFGLYRIKFYIENRFPGTRVDVVDPNLETVDFVRENYICIGFSLTHATLEYDLGLIYRAKKESPRSLLIAGGIEATFTYDWLLRMSCLDGVVLGEGEEVLENILSCYEPSEDIESIIGIRGFAVRGRDGRPAEISFGRYLDYGRFSFVSSLIDFAQIPYPLFWRANAGQYKEPEDELINAIRIFTGNYCPRNCTFCSSTNFLDYAYSGKYDKGKKIKIVMLNAEEIFNMIMCILSAQTKTRTIIFDDDNFLMSLNRLIQICQLVIEAKREERIPRNLTLICQSRVDSLKSAQAKGTLALMRDAGFRMVMYGVESFSENVLAEFGKDTDIREVESVLTATAHAGIRPLIYLILFSPRSRLDDVYKTVIKSMDYLSQGMEVSINFYIMDIPGCHYHKEKDLIREFKEIPIKLDGAEVRRILKSEWIYPSDEGLRSFARKVYEGYPNYENFFMKHFGIQHIPGRIYTFIVFYAILDSLGCDGDKKRLLDIFQYHYAGGHQRHEQDSPYNLSTL